MWIKSFLFWQRVIMIWNYIEQHMGKIGSIWTCSMNFDPPQVHVKHIWLPPHAKELLTPHRSTWNIFDYPPTPTCQGTFDPPQVHVKHIWLPPSHAMWSLNGNYIAGTTFFVWNSSKCKPTQYSSNVEYVIKTTTISCSFHLWRTHSLFLARIYDLFARYPYTKQTHVFSKTRLNNHLFVLQNCMWTNKHLMWFAIFL